VIHRLDFADRVRSFVGTPFVHRGRSPGVGLDCAGVVVCALHDYGIESPDIRYGTLPSPVDIEEGLGAIADRIAVEERRVGDVLTMHVKGRGEIHMGVIVGKDDTGQDLLVHPSRRARIIEQPLTCGLEVAGCWRLRGVV